MNWKLSGALCIFAILVVNGEQSPFFAKSCTPCKGGEPPLTLAEAQSKLALLGDTKWQLRATTRTNGVAPNPELGSNFLLNVTSVAALDAGAVLSDESQVVLSLHRRINFDAFKTAVTFAIRTAAVCDREGHHADITLGYKYVDIVFYTHKIKGLHENDFIMAAKIDELTVDVAEPSANVKLGQRKTKLGGEREL